jgi:competence protein ComEC
MLESPRGVRNPGEFDAQEFYNANGITLLLTVKGSRHVCILDHDGGWWGMRQVVVPARRALLAHIEGYVGGEEGELLKGLMIGERGGLTPALRNAFLISGVAHILAVSGSNVAVVAAAVLAFLLLLRIPRRAHPWGVAGALLFYMLLTGSQPSVVRATIMGLVALAVSGRGARGNPLNAVGIAALIMYSIDARQLFDSGFQLSFAAVLSIVVLIESDLLIRAWKEGWFTGSQGGLDWVRSRLWLRQDIS